MLDVAIKTQKIKQTVEEKAPDLVIDCKGVSKRYGAIVALNDVSLQVHRGEFVSLVGPSGAGKSTLLKLIIREELPSEGGIVIAGKDITELRYHDIPYYRRQIGVVFQDFKLLPQKTVAENVAFALEVADVPDGEIERRVPKVLRLVGLLDRVNNYPAELSGGEKQRCAIARALVHGPKLLLADEPTGNLDPDSMWDVVKLLLRINDMGTIVILATHNKEIVDQINRRVIHITEGKVISDRKRGGYRL
jgi:cell division transport system ATP-binding protein